MKRAIAFLVGGALLSSVHPCRAQDLGRLFFTPEERAALDARRKARVPDRPSTPVVASPTTRLDGYVKRSSGASTVWINGASTQESAPGNDGRVTLPGAGGPRIPLKPGEVLDRGSGEVRDVIVQRDLQ